MITQEQAIKNCRRKRVYRSQTAALLTIHKRKKEKKLEPYTCPVCGQLHIGHKVPRYVRLNG